MSTRCHRARWAKIEQRVPKFGGEKKKEKEKEIAKQDWKELNEFMYGKSSVDA